MNKNKVPLLETGFFSGLTKLYIEQDERLTSFYNLYFESKNFESAIELRKNFNTNRTELFNVLNQQHLPYFDTFTNLENVVKSLKDNNTFTVTTGHQICLATGPVYFIYKIASAINLSKKLKEKFPQYNFIPVYWMATEDHDFEEINHIHLFNKKITWNKSVSGASGRVSTEGIETFLQEIKEILGEKIGSTALFDLISDAYQKHSNLADATRYLVLHLFANNNLLVIDADDKKLKNTFKEIIEKDIVDQISYAAVTDTIQQLITQQLIKEDKIQVKPRAINFFYLKDNLRKRIIFEEDTFKVIDTNISFTKTQLINEIDQFPERFSPNVIMRPVYQEFILPNLVYVGGAGELSYWFELKKVFDSYQVFFPMLALRNSFLWIEEKQYAKLNQLGIQIPEIFESIENLIEKTLKNAGVNALNFTNEINSANNIFDELKSKITAVEQTLSATVEAERQKLLKSIELLEQKVSKAQKLKFESTTNQLKKVKENLFPAGGLQERYDNLLWHSLKFGSSTIDDIIEMADLELKSIQVVCL